MLTYCAALCAATSVAADDRQTPDRYGRVELIRDQWGIPHLFADSDEGALYGLGYATAEDRGFQMTYSLRIIQGRLAEVVGEVRHTRRNESSIDSDRKMRTFGFYPAAQNVSENLDPQTVTLLTAYCAGVNDYFSKHRSQLHPLFERLGIEPEPWQPADCIASWWHLGQFFATDGTRDLIHYRNLTGGARAPSRGGRGRFGLSPPAGLTRLPPDDAAVIDPVDISRTWMDRVDQYAVEHRLRREHGTQKDSRETAPKFSHAWVVGGARTGTGSSVLVSDPQTPVRNPSMFYEYHLSGKTFNARGIGVPGSPALLIGFTDKVAWGLTALGADQADLFRLKTDPARPHQYSLDGEWRMMRVRPEIIKVRGGEDVRLTVRETCWGPVVTPFCFARPDEGDVALKRIPFCETDRETIQGAFAMLRAKDAAQFAQAIRGWRFPSANIVFGDREGVIGYWTLAAIPLRAPGCLDEGRAAHDGSSSKSDWQQIVPYELLPHVMRPTRGHLASGNNRPIASRYPIPLGIMTGSGGDTLRSWRLRQRLQTQNSLPPADVLDIHYDSLNPARRAIVGAGLHLRDVLKRDLSPDAARALEYLQPWYKAGASSRLDSPGAEVAVHLSTFFRFVSTDLAWVYGGGESGLAYFLKTIRSRIEANPQAELRPLEQQFVDSALATAWRKARAEYGPDVAAWNERARQQVTNRKLGYCESLDGFPSLDPDSDVAVPALLNVDGGTIQSQLAQSYTQYVPMHDPDQARSILPIGSSERPDSPHRLSTYELWAEGKLHPAPLSRPAVEQYAQSHEVLGR